MAMQAYRKSLADRKVQNMIHLRENADLMTATKITLAREEGRVEGRAEGLAEGEARGEKKKTSNLRASCRREGWVEKK